MSSALHFAFVAILGCFLSFSGDMLMSRVEVRKKVDRKITVEMKVQAAKDEPPSFLLRHLLFPCVCWF